MSNFPSNGPQICQASYKWILNLEDIWNRIPKLVYERKKERDECFRWSFWHLKKKLSSLSIVLNLCAVKQIRQGAEAHGSLQGCANKSQRHNNQFKYAIIEMQHISKIWVFNFFLCMYIYISNNPRLSVASNAPTLSFVFTLGENMKNSVH